MMSPEAGEELAGALRGFALEELGYEIGECEIHFLARRCRVLMKSMGAGSLESLLRLPGGRELLVHCITNKESRFFRHEEQFEAVEACLLKLVSRYGGCSVLSVGCSIGAEPYSVVVLLDRMGLAARVDVYGLDVDVEALREARKGEFSDRLLGGVSDEDRRRYFRRTPAGKWRFSPLLADKVRFRPFNATVPGCWISLAREIESSRGGAPVLVLMRNLLMYLCGDGRSRALEGISVFDEAPELILFVSPGESFCLRGLERFTPMREGVVGGFKRCGSGGTYDEGTDACGGGSSSPSSCASPVAELLDSGRYAAAGRILEECRDYDGASAALLGLSSAWACGDRGRAGRWYACLERMGLGGDSVVSSYARLLGTGGEERGAGGSITAPWRELTASLERGAGWDVAAAVQRIARWLDG